MRPKFKSFRRKPKPNAYWNGEPAWARKVIVVVGHSPSETWWCASLEGTRRTAVEVISWSDTPFFLDDVSGAGWRKVTEGRGSPQWGHSSLPSDSRVVEVVDEPRGYPIPATL